MTTQNVTIEQFRRLEVKLQKTIENKQFSEALPIACEQEKLVKKQNLSHSKRSSPQKAVTSSGELSFASLFATN